MRNKQLNKVFARECHQNRNLHQRIHPIPNNPQNQWSSLHKFEPPNPQITRWANVPNTDHMCLTGLETIKIMEHYWNPIEQTPSPSQLPRSTIVSGLKNTSSPLKWSQLQQKLISPNLPKSKKHKPHIVDDNSRYII